MVCKKMYELQLVHSTEKVCNEFVRVNGCQWIQIYIQMHFSFPMIIINTVFHIQIFGKTLKTSVLAKVI
jgi:hypothetical protein